MADVYVFHVNDEDEEHTKEEIENTNNVKEASCINEEADKPNFINDSFTFTQSLDCMARPEEMDSHEGNQQRLEESSHLVEEDSSDHREYEDDEGTAEEDDEDESNLNPLARLLEWADSPNSFDKQMVARTIHETLRYVMESSEDVTTVLDIMVTLSTNDDPGLRTDLMEQVPQIAFLSHDYPSKLGNIVTGILVPMVVKYLTDNSDQVRKTSQAALLVLLEQELVSHGDVHDQVCPVILDLTEPDALDDFKTEAVALMSKMAPLVGREMTESLFVDRFTRLCSDTLFQVRKVCAANFGDFSGVVGPTATESVLLPRFVCLCEDGVWGVRKACADVFMVLSCACSLDARREYLSPVFVSLLSDQSRWVRIAAFQNLGPFISTFADPNETATDKCYSEGETNEEDATACSPKPSIKITEKDIEDAIKIIEGIDMSLDADGSTRKSKALKNLQEEQRNLSCMSSSGRDSFKDDPEFNELNWWRLPLPCVYIEESLIHATSPPNSSLTSDTPDENAIVEAHILVELEELSASLSDKVSLNLSLDSENPSSTDGEQNSPSLNGLKTQEIDSTIVSVEEVSLVSDSQEEEEVTKEVEIVSQNEIPLPDQDTKESLSDCTPLEEEEMMESSDTLESFANIIFESSNDLNKENFNGDQCWASEDPTEGVTTTVGQDESKPLSDDDEDDEDKVVFHSTSDDSSAHIFALFENMTSLPSLTSLTMASNYHQRPLRDSVPTLNIDQDIVPNSLLEHYISMTDPMQAETVDNEITRHCAYSLPAVTLTLGRSNWPVLKETYETLAADMHWKVRRTLAFSIHEMAFILGEELSQTDLLPVFEGFIKDLDEVRIGVLKHLAIFLKLLPQSHRDQFLPRLNEFLNPDNPHNWRFRLELALQLGPISDLFSAEKCWKFICPITFVLMADKVMEIRRTCFAVVSKLASRLLTQEGEECLLTPFAAKLEEKFFQSFTWRKRQSYVFLVGQIIHDDALPLSIASSLFLDKFLELASDKVPNIRLAVAKIINSSIMTKDFFCDHSDSGDRVAQVLEQLKQDEHRDVRYFALQSIPSEQ